MDELDASLFEIFGMSFERLQPTPQFTNEELQMISILEEPRIRAPSNTQYNLLHSSNQEMIDLKSIFGEEEEVDDELKGHSSNQVSENVRNSTISQDSGFCDEGLSASDSSSSSSPIDSEIRDLEDSNDQCSKLNDSNDQCSELNEYFRTSIPNSSHCITKEYLSFCTKPNKQSATATESVPARSDSNKPKLRIRQGVKKLYKQKVLECSRCKYSTYFKESLDQHIFKTHIQPNQKCRQIQSERNVTFKCDLGDFESTDFSLVVNHKYEVHGIRNFKCARCGLEATSMLEYIMHINNYPTHIISPLSDRSNLDNTTTQTFSFDVANRGTIYGQTKSKENVLFKCELGDFESTEFSLLVNHKYEVHGIRNFQCIKCPMKTSSMLDYLAHMKLYPTHMDSLLINRSGQYNMKNRSAGKNNERENVLPTLNETKEQPVANGAAIQNQEYTCTECMFSTPDMRTFVNHKFETHKYRWFKCPRCRVCSTSTNASMEHFRKNPTHMIPYVEKNTPDKIIVPRPEKPRRYKPDENLIIEMKKEGDKEKIVITPKSFFFKNRNKGEIKFYCEVCKFNAPTYKQVLLHRKTIHNLDMRCSGCSYTTTTIYEFKKHLVDNPAHMTEYNSCNHCDFGTYDPLVLMNHERSEHFRNVQDGIKRQSETVTISFES